MTWKGVKDMEQLVRSNNSGGSIKCTVTLEKSLAAFDNVKNITWPKNLPQEKCQHMFAKKICTRIFTVTLFIIAKKQN